MQYNIRIAGISPDTSNYLIAKANKLVRRVTEAKKHKSKFIILEAKFKEGYIFSFTKQICLILIYFFNLIYITLFL